MYLVVSRYTFSTPRGEIVISAWQTREKTRKGSTTSSSKNVVTEVVFTESSFVNARDVSEAKREAKKLFLRS